MWRRCPNDDGSERTSRRAAAAAQAAQPRACERVCACLWVAPPLLDIRTLFHQLLMRRMSREKNPVPGRVLETDAKHFAKIYSYPGGVVDIVASTSPVFGCKGMEIAEDAKALRSNAPASKRMQKDANAADPESLERSMRRARSKLRRLALANDFRWFVTLTIDPEKVDSFDGAAVVKKLNAWCSNMVQRRGLRYILVPERHKSGRIHFHGFFNDVVEAVESGHTDSHGHPIYNLPQWALGFTTAIELYDHYQQAVGYVCKYVGKQGEKPAGRWYYSGGDLREPEVTYAEISPAELRAEYGDRAFVFYPPGCQMAVVNGIKVHDQVHDRRTDTDENGVFTATGD